MDVVLDLLRRQQNAGFPDLSGAEASATIPIGDRLINELLAASLPKDGRVEEVRIQAEPGNRVRVRLRLSGSHLLPPIGVTLAIVEQPELPAHPVLGLHLAGIPKLLMLTGVLDRFRRFLPPGVTIEGEQVRVNLDALLRHHGHADLLRHLTALTVTTRDGAVIVAFRAHIA